MKCNERARLLSAKNRAALAVSTTVEELLNGVGIVSCVVYDLRRHAAAEARIGFEFARLPYEAHLREHCCCEAEPKPVNCTVDSQPQVFPTKVNWPPPHWNGGDRSQTVQTPRPRFNLCAGLASSDEFLPEIHRLVLERLQSPKLPL
jgi:hypothetical protein